MYRGKRILAVIPARGGSKGIKNKNIVDLNGKPLIQYTIDSAKGSHYIDKVIVSTDSEEIKEVSEKLGAQVPFLRPMGLASDTARTIDVLVHTVDELKRMGEEYDYLVLLQPTSPLRKTRHINEAIKLMLDNEYRSLVSVHEVEDHPILIRTIEDSYKMHKLIEQSSTMRRQDFKKYYKVNGAIYINELKVLNNETSLNDNEYAYIMERMYSVDIDEELDLKYAKVLLEQIDNND